MYKLIKFRILRNGFICFYNLDLIPIYVSWISIMVNVHIVRTHICGEFPLVLVSQ